MAYRKRFDGWASYGDTVYTSVSPFTVLENATSTLPNNAGTVINSHLPVGTASFYNSGTSKITPTRSGDYNIITVRFNAECSHIDTAMDFGIDIGGSQGVIFKDVKVFPKGNGVTHPFSFVCPGYSLDTFIANGGLVKITAVNGDIDIYDIEYQIARVSSIV